PVSATIGILPLDPLAGPVGTVVTVSGGVATPGLMVEIYWDETLVPAKFLNDTRALGDGTYSCEITIPAATAGDHYIIAYDVNSQTAIGEKFTVEPEIVLSPTSGLPPDSITVTGTGFTATSDIDIFFEQNYAWSATLVTYGTGTATWTTDYAHTGDYSVKLYAPMKNSGTHSGKIILPMEMPFAELLDFSVYVEGDGEQALPLNHLELDIADTATNVDLSGGTNTYWCPSVSDPENVDLTSFDRVLVNTQPGQSEGDIDPLVTDTTAG
ncbi:unnamed protein product, partial [marine sediment metagenome]